MATWLDWYVRWRVEAPESQESLAHQMRLGATNPLMALAETIHELLALWTVDRERYARKTGLDDPKSQEELALRAGCMAPFLRGFATPVSRKLGPHGRPLGIVLTRDTASLLADADPPRENWRDLTFGSAPDQGGLSGVYVDVPHGALRVGENLQIRAIFALPHLVENNAGELQWDRGVLVHSLVTVAGSERESGAVFVEVNENEQLSLVAMDPQTIMGGITVGETVLDPATEVAVYQRVMEHSVRFLRMVLAYYRYGPVGSQQPIGQTNIDRAATNRFKPRKGESLFAMTRLVPTSDRLGRPRNAITGSWSLTARQEVSGHFRLQPHGRGGALRRLIWVDPYSRGPVDGPIKPRGIAM
jgi:hypothetical protein